VYRGWFPGEGLVLWAAMSTAELAQQPVHVALPRLLEEHGGRLYRMSMKLCGHREDAEDLVQDIFLIALKKWEQFHGDAHPTTWLYSIAARACGRKRRKRAGEPRRMESLSDLLPRPTEDIPEVAALLGDGEGDDPLRAQLRREAREAVEGAIAQLPFHFRLPLVLKEIAELPVAEVAAILGVKEATVKTRLHRARLLLRRALAEVLPHKPAPPPNHDRRICLDLLKAKQESLDRGVPFSVPPGELCRRCAALFGTLDLSRDLCLDLSGERAGEELPEPLRQALLEAFRGDGDAIRGQ
jgi:RNA polymerase sigma-70 factor, ECF subfamily